MTAYFMTEELRSERGQLQRTAACSAVG